ncbi:MAG: ribonuclease E/G [Candidatus Pacebacteria bacterium]|nr:ribonuclease E/G [Candidatus Paceibacterota bacterium]
MISDCRPDNGLVLAVTGSDLIMARVSDNKLIIYRKLINPVESDQPAVNHPPQIGDIYGGRITKIDPPRKAIFVDLGGGLTGMISLGAGGGQGSEGDLLRLRLAELAGQGKQSRLTIEPGDVGGKLGLLARRGDRLQQELLAIASDGASRIITNDGALKTYLARILVELGRDDLLARLEHRLGSAESLLQQSGVADDFAAAGERIQTQVNGSRLILEVAQTLKIIDVDRGGCDLPTVALNEQLATEIARLVALRQWGGLIVIDYLRMKSEREREQVWQSLRQQKPADGLGWALHGFTRAGLFEITRPKG